MTLVTTGLIIGEIEFHTAFMTEDTIPVVEDDEDRFPVLDDDEDDSDSINV